MDPYADVATSAAYADIKNRQLIRQIKITGPLGAMAETVPGTAEEHSGTSSGYESGALLRDALHGLGSAKTYKEVREARRRLLGIAPAVVDAVLAELAFVNTPEHETVFEALLVEGLNAQRALQIARSPRSPQEARAWPGILASYIEAERLPDPEVHQFLEALLELSAHGDPGVRISSADALSALAEDHAEARERLAALAEDADVNVRRVASGSLTHL